MASQGGLPYKDWRDYLHVVLQCETGRFFDSIRQARVWKKTKPKHKTSSRETQKGDIKMYNYNFGYKGGAKKLNQANYKFHVFIVDTNAKEHHLYGALKNGLVSQVDSVNCTYSSAVPVVKVFTATAGFGIPKEFFSYFIMLSPSTSKVINIKPLGFKNIAQFNWYFSGMGRFMSKDEVRRFFGATSDTWRFYQRQSFLSRTRLQELVSITEGGVSSTPIERHDEVRLVRFD